jgi:acyl carrier protein
MKNVDDITAPGMTEFSHTAPEREASPHPSGTPIEETVAAIWAQVLGVERVEPHDNFLLLGGESLLATQVASMIRETFNCDISMRSILVGTVADVAAEISAV